ncbi:MAG: U32 family peptidase, partial [Syntrophomonadaceae bacterium]|nr:U32 family peptidase [Syntrophomonadaceae bacterium]
MELLAPAGSWEAFLAAMGNGADAVYLGGKSYSARQSAENFTDQQIEDALIYAHLRDKRIYVTINTLVDQQEFKHVLDYISKLYNVGVDAVIVQDIGLMSAIRHIFPALRVHASTQMTIHNSAGAKFLAGQGLNRAVLAREMTRDEVETICREVPGMEFECFVHGALCYSYSGQCLFSSMLGGRSGNRGKCAQPCRLPYKLCSETGDIIKSKRGSYLLSPSDLCLIENLADLHSNGVKSLKIEGRMKRPEYVAVVTRAYREAMDFLSAGFPENINPEISNRLMKIFNRGFTKGHFSGDKTTFMSIKRPDNRGVEVGEVLKQSADIIQIKLNDSLRVGDGLEIEVSKGKGIAFQIRELKVMGKAVAQAGPGEVISLKVTWKASQGDPVYMTHDTELIDSALASIKYASENKIPVDGEVHLQKDKPLKIVFIDDKGNKAQSESRSLAEAAKKHPLDHGVLQEKVDKLGNTPFCLRNFGFYGDADLMVPFSEINDTRRRAIEELQYIRLQAYKKPDMDLNKYLAVRKQFFNTLSPESAMRELKTVLSIAVSGPGAAYAALKAGAGRVYLHLDGIAGQKRPDINEIGQIIEEGRLKGCEIVLALPRIQKPADISYQDYLDMQPESVLAGNIGSLHNCLQQGLKVRSDYSLNIFNRAALRSLLNQGVEGICLSPELNFRQLQSFNNLDKVELLVHGEIILMT